MPIEVSSAKLRTKCGDPKLTSKSDGRMKMTLTRDTVAQSVLLLLLSQGFLLRETLGLPEYD